MPKPRGCPMPSGASSTSEPGREQNGCTGNCWPHAPVDEVCAWCARHQPGREQGQQACAVRVWLDGVYPADCGHYINRGRCIKHGAGGPTKPVAAREQTSASSDDGVSGA